MYAEQGTDSARESAREGEGGENVPVLSGQRVSAAWTQDKRELDDVGGVLFHSELGMLH